MNKQSVVALSAAGMSGAAGLAYEIIWTRMFALGLGHETFSVLAVLAAFFGGSAAGALILDRHIASSRYPARWYFALEMVVGIWALALTVALPFAMAWMARLINDDLFFASQPILNFITPFVCLFPATFAMGGTMVAMERILSGLGNRVAAALAGLCPKAAT